MGNHNFVITLLAGAILGSFFFFYPRDALLIRRAHRQLAVIKVSELSSFADPKTIVPRTATLTAVAGGSAPTSVSMAPIGEKTRLQYAATTLTSTSLVSCRPSWNPSLQKRLQHTENGQAAILRTGGKSPRACVWDTFGATQSLLQGDFSFVSYGICNGLFNVLLTG